MKTLFGALIMFASLAAHGQVNLSDRVTVSNRDILYKSISEPGIAYVMPSHLQRMSEVKVRSVGDRIVVQFDVGIPDSEFNRLNTLLTEKGHPELKVSVLRAVKGVLEAGTDIDPIYRPIVTVTGDPKNLAGPVRYSLSVRNRGPYGPKNRTALMLQKFFGPGSFDHLTTLKIEFDSVAAGAPMLAQTSVPVLVHENENAKSLAVAQTGLVPTFSVVTNVLRAVELEEEVKYLYDRETGCWDKPQPRVICLK